MAILDEYFWGLAATLSFIFISTVMRCALGDYPPPVSQWRRRLSACVTVGISSTFCDGFVVQCVKLMPSKFLNLWFYCLTVLFVAKM